MVDDERYKPEWRDFEKRFRNQLQGFLEKLNELPPDVRTKTEDKLRERYRQEEKETLELSKKEPDFYNRSTQAKYMGIVDSLLSDADTIVDKALAAQKSLQQARKLRDDLNRSQSRPGPDKDRDMEK